MNGYNCSLFQNVCFFCVLEQRSTQETANTSTNEELNTNAECSSSASDICLAASANVNLNINASDQGIVLVEKSKHWICIEFF